MEAPVLTDLVSCHVGVGPDPDRVALVVDYRGDRPPVELFEVLQRYGWSTPAPHAPPASVIDWDRPDPATGRRWSLRPFLVVGAIAVPGPAAPDWSATVGWLTSAVEGCGLVLSGDPLEVGTVREPRQGLVELVFDHVDVPVDPFEQNVPATAALPTSTTATAAGLPLRPSPSPSPPQLPAPGSVPETTPAVETAPAPETARVEPPESTTEPVPDPVDQAQPLIEAPLEPVGGLPAIDVAERALPGAEKPALAESAEPASAPLVWTGEDPILHQRTVWAVVRRAVLGQVVQLLHDMGVEEDAVMLPVTGWGRGGGLVTRYRGVVSVEPLQRIEVQVAVDPVMAEELRARLVEMARIGDKGDGKIWVT